MKKILLTTLAFIAIMCVNAQIATVFHESFNSLTSADAAPVLATANADKNSDEKGYVVGGGDSNITLYTAGQLSMLGARWQTKNLDLTGSNVTLTVKYKVTLVEGQGAKKFQIDVDKNGTSGMGTLFAENQDASVTAGATTDFVTKVFTIEGATTASYVHFRTESLHQVIIDDILITKSTSSVSNPESAKEIKAVNYFDVLGKEIKADTKGFVVVKTTYTDGTVGITKFFKK